MTALRARRRLLLGWGTAALLAASVGCSVPAPTTNAAIAGEPKPAPYVPLAAPPADQGVQITTGRFDVPPGSEVQKNVYLKLPVDHDVMVRKIEIDYPPGSHHCSVFKSDTENVPDHAEDTFDAIAYEKYDIFANAQVGGFQWELPQGVGIKLTARQQLIIQTHFVNAFTQKTPGGQGAVRINLWFAPPESIRSTLGMCFAINKNLDIAPHSATVATKIVDLARLGWNHDVQVIGMSGHFHSRGKTFSITRWDGSRAGDEIYRSDNWDEPPFKRYEPALALKAGEPLRYSTTFVNDTAMVIRFGPHVETQEHSNLFMYFYPGPPSGKALYDTDGSP